MSFFLLLRQNRQPFDLPSIRRSLQDGPGAIIRDGNLCKTSLMCEFQYNNDVTAIRPSKPDGLSIAIDVAGDAGLQAALLIQRGHNDPVHMIDDGYNFDIDLSKIKSLKDLIAAVDNPRDHE